MPVIVKTSSGQSLSYDVSPTDTVQALKEKIQASQQIDAALQTLFFNSKVVENASTLASLGITDGKELQLTVAAAGSGEGAASARAVPGASHVSASLWVGDLEKSVTWQTLYEVFNPVAPVASIRVCRHHITHESLGYAYVNFHSHADADRVLNTMNYTQIMGRPCRVMWSERDASSRRSGKANIFIKNLNPEIDVQVLHDTFSKFGNVTSCKVAMHPDGRPKGYGFVAFTSEEEAQAAISSVNGKKLDGYQVSVRKYVPRDQRQKTAEWNNVFVKDFPLTWDEAKLQEEFGVFGPISSMFMAKDAEGKTKGTAFVCFDSHEAALKATEQMNGKTMRLTKVVKTMKDGEEVSEEVTVEKPLYVARAQKKEDRIRQLETQRAEQRKQRNAHLLHRNLFVRNLDESVTEQMLQEAFATHGAIESVRIPRDGERSKLFGFVCFVNQADASQAETSMNGFMLAGKPITVTAWLPREQRKAESDAKRQRGQAGAAGAQNAYMANMGRAGPRGRMQPPFMMNPAMMQQMQQWMHATMGQSGVQMNPQQLQMMQYAMMQQMQMYQMQVAQAQQAAQAHGMVPGQQVGYGQGQPGGAMPQPQPTEQLSIADQLTKAAPEERLQLAGGALFKRVLELQPEQVTARKITGMLIESAAGDTSEILNMIESPEELRTNVQGAMEALRSASGPAM